MRFRLPAIELPEIKFQINEKPSESTIEHYQGLVTELSKMNQSMGHNDQFKKRLSDLINAVKVTDILIDEVKTSRDIRIVIHLWQVSDWFVMKFPVSSRLLERFRDIRHPQSQLALFGLTQLFFKRFDECGDVHALMKFMIQEYSYRKSFHNFEMEALRKRANQVLSLQGPEKIVKATFSTGNELSVQMQAYGISEEQSGKFVDKCRQHYFIESLKLLSPGEDSAIFSQLVEERIAKGAYKNNWLGHEVLKIMIDKVIVSNEDLPENWRDIILGIADDPRISDRSASYREWWAVLSMEYVEAMQGWLAGFDLKIFLSALENFAKASRDASLTRMFPARARFLKGLYEHGLISFSKLFIGYTPARYIRSLSEINITPKFSTLSDSDLSVIYLKVGHVHMVEGSHSFSLRIYNELPDKRNFLSYSRSFARRELGVGLAEKYNREFGQMAFSVAHNPNLTWQNKVIRELRKQGVHVNPEWVLTPEDYRDYRRRFSI